MRNTCLALLIYKNFLFCVSIYQIYENSQDIYLYLEAVSVSGSLVEANSINFDIWNPMLSVTSTENYIK